MIGEQIELNFDELMRCNGMLFYIAESCVVKIVVNKYKDNFELVYLNKHIPSITFKKGDFHKLCLYKYLFD